MSYRELKSYQQATIVYDFTVEFCSLYIDFRSRTKDQMVQAARSGKQNIVEGSTQRTSSKTELKLLGVARASLQELLEDYEDFLRQRRFSIWKKDDLEAQKVRSLAYMTDMSYMTYKSYLEKPEHAANAMLCLVNQTNFLLDRHIKVLEERFIRVGGYSENLFKKRALKRNKI